MKQSIATVALVVRDYDEALAFYVGKLGFELIEDTPLPNENKRWVVIAPPGSTGTRLLLATASDDAQHARIGDQTGGRVSFFLQTDDFERDHTRYAKAGVIFTQPPRHELYGKVVVFRDLYGNLWDLIEPR
ncbi:VOC family protein [Synoicihabitans lomoniglobus]|uniref:VOC family protein n=1 Tax=Synoicihabitans lomoniglobus TaxID=2909285 RepID=A0AAF0CSK2_9BACT|nr:VOC family protein [Opitutaceae bacterium LMO-M01]WED67267.1 VOC family protein [Opitutaceae bacterium LMO-M01]